jgi:pimeloyl-ACP methyl ester carboxylesterase
VTNGWPRSRLVGLLERMNALLLAVALWGNLEAGPHAVGFTQLERWDHSRVYRTARDLAGKPRTGPRARPIRVSIWYPALPSQSKPMTFGDYVDLVAGETTFGLLTAEQKRAGEDTFFALPVLNTMSREQRNKVRPLPTRAFRDAKPASGRFPLILYSLGSAALAHSTPEFLASHGYVVVQSPRVGAFAGLPPDNRDALDLETKLRDVDFLINVMKEHPQADVANMGAIGFSAGGRWALAAAMKHPDVRAVVSLDSVMLFSDPVTEAWRRMPHYNLDAVRVAILHLQRTEFAKQDDLRTWDALRYADRRYVELENPALTHWDFQSIGLVTALSGLRAKDTAAITETFDRFNNDTLAFLDAHLKGKPLRAMAGRHTPAQAAPITVAEFMNAIAEDGVDAAIAAYPRERPLPEAALNVAGYTLLFGGNPQGGLRLMQLNAEIYAASSNVWDSLADAYLAVGDRAKAVELAKKALALLEKEEGLTDERRAAIRGSIDAKLK